jgi:hypothetical protein
MCPLHRHEGAVRLLARVRREVAFDCVRHRANPDVLRGGAQRARVEEIQKKKGRIAWATACIKAGFFRVEQIGAEGRRGAEDEEDPDEAASLSVFGSARPCRPGLPARSR